MFVFSTPSPRDGKNCRINRYEKKKAKKKRRTGFIFAKLHPSPSSSPTNRLSYPLLMIEGRARGLRWSECHVGPGCLRSNVQCLLAHWSKASLLARGANDRGGSSGSSQCKGVCKKKHCWRWTVLVLVPLTLSLSLSLSLCGQIWNVCVCGRGVGRALLQDSWLPPTRAGLFLLCVVLVLSCLYRDVDYLVTTVQEVTRSKPGV